MFCDSDYVSWKPSNFTIMKESEFPVELFFRPLTSNPINANFIIKSPDLGELKYPLLLKGLSSSAPKTLQPIVTFLGSDKDRKSVV